MMETVGTNTEALLREFRTHGSEAAFEALVSRYINLVYSVACRRVGGDTHLAQDVVQTVFTDLARKASRLPDDVMLGGWLHRHTCFVASTIMRSNRRRLEREQQAVNMNVLTDTSNASWNDIAPVLDEAIDELPKPDRTAIVLRFFESCNFRTIGNALGSSEDAAQKRLSRALEKLRDSLTKRGVAFSVAALAAALTNNSIAAAPTFPAAIVARKALEQAAIPVGMLAALLALLTPPVLKSALVTLALLATVSVFLWSPGRSRHASSHSATPSQPRGDLTTTSTKPEAAVDSSATIGASTNNNGLRLLIVAADSGRPIPNVPLSVRITAGEFSRTSLTANREGVCNIPLDRTNVTQLEIITRIDEFADTRLHWRPDRGEQIPESYTLRLIRPARIGGRVVDPDGRPLAGAKVGWNHEADPTTQGALEDHEFSWIEVTTDDEGRWRINRIAPDLVRRLYGSASHPEHAGTSLIFVGRDPKTEQALRDQTHVFTLSRATTVTGVVVDPQERPVYGAKVLVGGVGNSDSRRGITAVDGSFVIRGCKPGDTTLSAEAADFATTTLPVTLTTNAQSFRIRLHAGRKVIVRVLDQSGQPVPKARFWLNTFDHGNRRSTNKPPQVDFTPDADENGIMTWSNAPEGELAFKVHKRGYMESGDVFVEAEETEKAVVLLPALEISGSVHDESGQPIPRFRLICGWPERDLQQQIVGTHWSSIDRHWANFSGGQFRHVLEEAILGGTANPGYVFKIEANDFLPYVSRVIAPDEGKVQLDVTLRPAVATLVTVLLPDGRPAANADVGLVYPGSALQLIPGGISRTHAQDLTALLRTDANGQFRFERRADLQRVIAAMREGYAEALPGALANEPTIRLQPWGRIEGAYRINGQPARGRSLALDFFDRQFNSVRCIENFAVETDSEGRFQFPVVPSGRLKLMEWVPSPQPNDPTTRSGLNQKEVAVDPGQTVSVELGGNNYRITANVHLAGDLQFPPEARMHCSLWPATWNTPEHHLSGESIARVYSLERNPDGTWTGSEVAPGKYLFQVRVITPPSGTLVASGRSSAAIDVLAQPTSDPIDFGEVLVSKAVRP